MSSSPSMGGRFSGQEGEGEDDWVRDVSENSKQRAELAHSDSSIVILLCDERMNRSTTEGVKTIHT